MIYDMNRKPDVGYINNIVRRIRTRGRERLSALNNKTDVLVLTSFLSVESCEHILNKVFDFPWIPTSHFNALTTRQITPIIGCSLTVAQRECSLNRDDRERIARSDLEKMAIRKIEHRSEAEASSVLVFSNGTTMFLPAASSFFVMNARAVMSTVVNLAKINNTCGQFLEKVSDMICSDSEWIMTEPDMESEAERREAAVNEIVSVIHEALPASKAASVPEPASEASGAEAVHAEALPHTYADSLILRFLNALKPGTKVQIIVPA